MALNPNALWTVAEVKSIFDVGETTDAVIELLVNAVSDEIESFCRDKFVAREETLVLDGNDRQILDLGSRAVSVSEVREGDSGKASEGTIRDPSTYVVHAQYGQLFSPHRWKFGVRNIQVVGVVGWGARDQLPLDLRMVALRAVQKANSAGLASALVLPPASESVGEYSYSLAMAGVDMRDLLGSDHATLLRYRRWSVA